MICGIVLAAGRSKRMETQKLLLPWRDKQIITHIADEILRSPVQQVFVVIGKEGAQIKEALGERHLNFIVNPDSQGDMLSSVRCGLRALPGRCDGVLIVLGDQPTVSSQLVSEMVCTFEKNRSRIIIPVYKGRHGHPMLFSTRFKDEVLRSHEGIGLRGLVRSHPTEVIELEVSTSATLEDIDTPQDYQRLRHP